MSLTFDTSAVGLLGGGLALTEADSGPLRAGEILWQGDIEDLVVQRVTVCRETHKQTLLFPGLMAQNLQLVRDEQHPTVRSCCPAALLTGSMCRLESLLSFGLEAVVGPVQHGFDLVFWIVRLAGGKRFLRPDTGHL